MSFLSWTPDYSSNRDLPRTILAASNKWLSFKSTQFHHKGLIFTVSKLPLGPMKVFYLCLKSPLISKWSSYFKALNFSGGNLLTHPSESSLWFVPLEKVNIFPKQLMGWKVGICICVNQRLSLELGELASGEQNTYCVWILSSIWIAVLWGPLCRASRLTLESETSVKVLGFS